VPCEKIAGYHGSTLTLVTDFPIVRIWST